MHADDCTLRFGTQRASPFLFPDSVCLLLIVRTRFPTTAEQVCLVSSVLQREQGFRSTRVPLPAARGLDFTTKCDFFFFAIILVFIITALVPKPTVRLRI